MHRYNYNLYSHGSFIGLGTIYDRNGVELVKTDDSEKIYNDDEDIRKSTLHIVGCLLYTSIYNTRNTACYCICRNCICAETCDKT